MKPIYLFTLLLASTAMSAAESPTIRYTLGMSKPSTHFFEVGMQISGIPPSEKETEFIMPVWRTGRYVVFDFSGGVQEFSAEDADHHPLEWKKIDKSTWRVTGRGSASIAVRYKVFANEFGSRTRGLNDEHAFVDPATVFMYVEKYKGLPLTVAVAPYLDWHVTTGMEPAENEKNIFAAPDYAYFADCPIEVGRQQDFLFDAEGKKHELMIFGEGNYDAKKITADLSTLIHLNKEFWGELPYERYVFMLHLGANEGGGTEHINSTIMGERPFVFKNPDAYRGFLGLVSHEYFHTWNVKRLRPAGIHPYDFSRENYLRELWIAEGTTDYYGSLNLVRAGFKSASQYLEELSGRIQRDRLRPGNKVQSLSESSFDAWVKFWKGTQQAYNTETDYYSRGADVSGILDLEIRHRSNNRHSLDDVMKAMYERFPLSRKGYTVDDFQAAAGEMAGGDLAGFFRDYVHGTKPLPWEQALAYAGLEVSPRDSVQKPWLGIQTSESNDHTRVYNIIAGSPAYNAGLDIGDEILALNGFRARSSDLQSRIAEMKEGDKVTLTVFRDEKLREFEVTLMNQTTPAYKLTKAKNPTDDQKKIYEGWLKTKWGE